MPAPTTTQAVWSELSSDLWRFLRRRVADDHVADDLLQETFLRIHRRLSAVEHADRLLAWVYRIARNVLADHFRRQSHAGGSPERDEPAAAPPDRWAPLCGQAHHWLDALIEQLPEVDREVVRLAEVEGLPHREIAARLGLSLAATKSRIRRGRLRLKQTLEQCCHFEFDRRGNLTDVTPRADRTICPDCETLVEWSEFGTPPACS